MSAAITKIILPVAGLGTRLYPITKTYPKAMLPILNQPLIDLLIAECQTNNILEVWLVVSPQRLSILNYLAPNLDLDQLANLQNKLCDLKVINWQDKKLTIKFIIQKSVTGLVDALVLASRYLKNEPFGLILGDELATKKSTIKYLIDTYHHHQGSIIGFQKVPITKQKQYGIIELSNKQKQVNKIIQTWEKPELGKTNSLQAMRGRYVFSNIFTQILKQLDQAKDGKQELSLGTLIGQLITKETTYGYHLSDPVYDLGSLSGFVKAQIDFALAKPILGNEIRKYLTAKEEIKYGTNN